MELMLLDTSIIRILILLYVFKLTKACMDIGTYDFNALDGVIWESHNDKKKYLVSLCRPLNELKSDTGCGASAVVCQVNDDGETLTLGHFSNSPNITELDSGVIQLTLAGDTCLENSKSHTTVINFKCGKTLGSPLFLSSYPCETNFEWYTTAACKKPASVNEVKCYVYNDKEQKIDLGPLIKTHGGHEVLNFGPKFYINVCREITSGLPGEASGCEAGSAACILLGTSYESAGHAKNGLQLDDTGRAFLKYTSEVKGDNIPADCTQGRSTLVTFMCPARGQSGKPTLLSSLDCQYEILWETEYACPEETLQSNGCTLKSDIHGIDVDLTPLQVSGHPYRVSVNVPEQYTYYLSICEAADVCKKEDGSSEIAACQISQDDIDSTRSMGTVKNEQLRYADGALVLTYKGGAKCHTNFQRMTVINFHCMSKEELGSPQFTAEDDCTYIFDWDTPLACVKHYNRSTCQVENKGQLYDLSNLIITENMDIDYWEALKTDQKDDSFVILNVCRELPYKGLAILCNKGVAACVMDKPGHWMSLGKPNVPVYDVTTGEIQLHYTEGSPCGQGQAESIINFICKPGVFNGQPQLIHKSDDGCHYEFEWETASACAQNQVIGTDCHVVDEELGLSFDLRPLINTDKGYYLVHHPESHHDYYINVCARVTDTPCNTADRTDANMAACQIDTVSKRTFNTGQVSTKLRYGNNFLNLTYVMGDPYNSSPQRQRSTEIAFFCNPTVGKGEPEFVEETNYTYVFRWPTSYACADVPVECAVLDNKTGDEYDLTSLVRKPSESDWVTVDDEQSDQKKRTFYINICHHLISGIEGCDSESSICEKTLEGSTDAVSHANLGKSTRGPTIDSRGELTLVFAGGESCTSNPAKNYTTKIHLHCDHGAIATSPRLLGIDQALCQYVFAWDHAAACPVEHDRTTPGDICTLTDSNLGFTYNLKPLMKTDYNVTHSGNTYQLHICGRVSGNCQRIGEKEPAVCLGSQTLGEVNTHLEYAGSGFITLTYRGKLTSTGEEKVVIEFRCDRSIGEGKPQFTEKDGLMYLFRFPTVYACPPATTECKAVDDRGNLYDLSYLSKTVGNWEVVDTRPSHGDLRYYINVCHPVNLIAGETNFCSGLAGGCQTNSNGQTYSLGYIQGSPVAAENGTLILRYSGGDRCHKDKDEENFRSTVIIFQCSNVEHDPVFVEETKDCEYHFSWVTPLACPVSRSVGSQCRVITPNFQMTFDLSALQKADYYKIPAGEYEFWLNVCKDISDVTGECLDAGSCQTKPANNQFINAGKANGRLIYEDGELRLVYKGGKDDCHGHYERQTIITFTCDTKAGNGLPVYLKESSTCQYLFQWPTALACSSAQAEIRECSIQDDMGKQYDLSGLRMTNGNYVYLDPEKKVKYLINVCAGVVHGRGAACSAKSAVCLVHLNTTASDRYENLGEYTTSEIKVESDMIILKYSEGRQCSNGMHATTTIQLKCDRTQVVSEPYLLDDADGCNYAFQWMTSHACPINTATTPSGGDCTTVNPLTGVTLSLDKLKNRKWTVKDGSGHSYDVSVCSALKDSYCGSNVASCQYETDNPGKFWNSGTPTSSLIYKDGILHLEYTGGAKCHNNMYERSTVIDFVCGISNRGEGEPVFITESANCTYFLSWHTDLACESEPLICSADTVDHHFDLSSLMLSEGYHSAITTPDISGDASYYINLCRPLNPIPGTKCPPDAAVCKVDSSGKVMSLGRSLQSPKVDPITKKVTIVMEHGDSCASDRTKFWKSWVIFECDPGLSAGTPSLEEVNEDTCEVVFSWPTYLVCTADAQPDVDNDCTFTDRRRDYTYDFTSLKHKIGEVGYAVATKKKQGTYYLNICGSTSARGVSCGSAGVCLVKDNKATSFGRADKIMFVSSEFNIKLIYSGGDDCHGRARESYIIMECDYGATETGKIEVSYEQNCSVAFRYRTHLACPPVTKDCIFAHGGVTYDLAPLSRSTGSWTLEDADKNVYWFNLCQGIHAPPLGCPRDAAVCWQPTDGTGVSALARVVTQTASVDASGNILLMYSNGDSLCRNQAGTKGAAKFKVYLTCGSGVGKPTFKTGSSDPCLFEIEWKTTFACKEKREPVFANSGYITDPRTNQKISMLELSGGRTYEVNDPPHKYILNLDGLPAVDSQDCDNVVICQTNINDNTHHESLGEKDTQTFFIKGEILEAHYTSPSLCSKDSSTKAMSIIDFHCSLDNKTIGPVFLYKSKKCQYVFDWFTPALCSLAQRAQQETAANNHVLNSAALGAVLGISFTLLVFVFLTIILYKPERRARVTAAFHRLFRKPTAYTSYSYSSLNQAAEEDSSLLHNSQGQYGADSHHTSNIQAYDDDSDEDILQL